VIVPKIQRNAPCPGAQSCRSPETGQTPQDVNKGLLGEVLRKHRVTAALRKKTQQVTSQVLSRLCVQVDGAPQ
jgi:hypothetical protein